MPDATTTAPATPTIREEIEIAGDRLVERVRHLLHEGNVRSLKIVAEDGDARIEMPLTVGVVAGGALALAAPWLAALGVIAAMVSKVRLEVEREAEAPTLAEPPKAPAEA